MLPDDCSECRVCGVPVLFGHICIWCDPVRDQRGRFVSREIADRYRSLEHKSIYAEMLADRAEARRSLDAFLQEEVAR